MFAPISVDWSWRAGYSRLRSAGMMNGAMMSDVYLIQARVVNLVW